LLTQPFILCRETQARANLQQLESDIRALVERHNDRPKPYRWTKPADEILSSVKRFC
jgi:hypothetical protein